MKADVCSLGPGVRLLSVICSSQLTRVVTGGLGEGLATASGLVYLMKCSGLQTLSWGFLLRER